MTFLTREEVATYLRVHPRTVERWLKSGSLKGYKLGKEKTSLWRIPENEVNKFLEKHASTKTK
jgi:excisionase family DNA binding protein